MIDHYNKYILTGCGTLLFMCVLGLGWLITQQRTFESRLHVLEIPAIPLPQQQEKHETFTQPQTIVEKVVSTAQLWRPIQEQVSDTVVQIFAHISAIDILKPYVPPTQGQAAGSAFFINDQGDLITNAHVVNQGESFWIQIPSLGKRIIDVELISISPERDLALLRVKPASLEIIRQELGKVPFLPLGDSDTVRRSDEVLALGYPLAQQSLKSTTGVVSGREHNFIQLSAAINPGSSGGPLLNTQGQVIGINSSGVTQAQNVGYAIPVSVLKSILPDLYTVPLLHKPFLGVVFSSATVALVEFLGNPQPGGAYIVEVVPESTLDKAGVERGDMIYAINGHIIDRFGEMNVPWSEDKISVPDYVSRLSVGDKITIVFYRRGKRFERTVDLHITKLPSVRTVYPGYEPIDYEIFGGMVVMELTKNHIALFNERASGLAKFLELRNQREPVLVITHIFSNSQLYRSRTLSIGCTINEINGIKVTTLDEYRKAIKQGMGSKFLTILASDNVKRASDNVFVVLPMMHLLEEEPQLAQSFKYPITAMGQELIRLHKASQATTKVHK